MKEQIVKLVEEGEKLKETFTEEAMVYKLTNDRQSVSKWITKCMRIIEYVENLKDKSPIYIKLSNALEIGGNLDSKRFDELVGLMEGVNETYFEVDKELNNALNNFYEED